MRDVLNRLQSGQRVDWAELSIQQAVLIAAVGEEFVEQTLVREQAMNDAFADIALPGVSVRGVTRVDTEA